MDGQQISLKKGTNRSSFYPIVCLLCSVLVLLSANAQALPSAKLAQFVETELKTTLLQSTPSAKITIPSLSKMLSQSAFAERDTVESVSILEIRDNGTLLVSLSAGEKTIRFVTPYEMVIQAAVAQNRIYPGQKIKTEDLIEKEIVVSRGLYRSVKNTLITLPQAKQNQIAKNSILEGQPLLYTSIQRSPDLKRGEVIALELTSGDLLLKTQAIVQEPAVIGEKVRVITVKTKRELVGVVTENNTVEVKL